MKTFKLINPLLVGGSMNTEYIAESGLEAASQFWSEFGSYLVLNVPKLYITIQNENGKISHYKIQEKMINKNKVADYTISEFKVDLSKSREEKFLDGVQKYTKHGTNLISNLIGGSIEKKPKRDRSKDSSSSSSDSDSDSENNDYYNFRRYRTHTNAPFNMLYYTPLIYNINTVVIPTFLPTVAPYVTLYMPVF